MGKNISRFWIWTPRIIAILFIIFISLFVLDVFSEKYSFAQLIIAFLIHLVPSLLLLVALLIAWKHAKTGGIIFCVLGILFIILMGIHESLYVPFFVIGALFFISRISQNKKLLTNQTS